MGGIVDGHKARFEMALAGLFGSFSAKIMTTTFRREGVHFQKKVKCLKRPRWINIEPKVELK